MSSFRNAFQKEESKNLQYDNTAFLHFIISFVITGAVIFFLAILKQFLFNAQASELSKIQKNPLFKSKAEKQKQKLSKRFKSNSFIFKIVCLMVFIVVFILCINKISAQPTKLKGFDPYELLGVQYDTPPEKIKKAYRKLALLLHPDRNPNNPEAATKFMLISKAYQCLTDEKVKENCKKYGNPQGHQAFNVGIALPSILLQQENQILVMASIFTFLLIIIPKIFMNWNNRLQIKDQRGILVQNYDILYKYFKKKLNGNKIMLMLCRLKQAQHEDLKGKTGTLEVPPEQKKIDEVSDSEIQENKKEQEQKNNVPKIRKIKVTASAPQNVKGIISFISKKEGNSLVVQKMPELLKQAIYFSLDFCTRSPRKRQTLYPNQTDKAIEYFGMGQLESLISWGQIFYQAAPYYTQNGIETLQINQQQFKLIKEYKLRDLIKNQKLRQKFLQSIAEDRRQLVESQIKTLPNLNLKVQPLIDNKPIKEATQRDTVIVKITIDKFNPNSSMAYLKYYPNLKKQIFYLTIQAHNTLMYFEEIIFDPNQRQIVIEYTYTQTPNDEEMNFIVKLRSDCYLGIDLFHTYKIKFNQYDGEDMIEFHKDDLNIEKQPKGYFQSMFSLDNLIDPEDNELSDTEEDDQSQQEEQNDKQEKTSHDNHDHDHHDHDHHDHDHHGHDHHDHEGHNHPHEEKSKKADKKNTKPKDKSKVRANAMRREHHCDDC